MADEHRGWVVPPRAGTFRDIDLGYLDPNDPDERRILIEADHPEYADALEADDEVLVDGQPMNPSLHVSMHEIVTNQIWDLDPPETWATAQRLTDLGYDRHEVIHMLGGAVTSQLWRALHEQEPFALAGFLADLDALPDSWEQQRSEAQPRRRTRRPSPWIGGSR